MAEIANRIAQLEASVATERNAWVRSLQRVHELNARMQHFARSPQAQMAGALIDSMVWAKAKQAGRSNERRAERLDASDVVLARWTGTG